MCVGGGKGEEQAKAIVRFGESRRRSLVAELANRVIYIYIRVSEKGEGGKRVWMPSE